MAIAVIGPDLAKNGFQIGSMSFGVVDRSIDPEWRSLGA
jgi:hypothetical protein